MANFKADDYANAVSRGGKITIEGHTIRVVSPVFKSGSRKISLTTLSAIERRIKLLPGVTNESGATEYAPANPAPGQPAL